MTPLTGLGARDRRAAAIGLISCTLILGLGRGLPILREWESGLLAEAAEKELNVSRAESLALLEPQLRTGAARADSMLTDVASLAFTGETPSQGGATLAALLTVFCDSAVVSVGAMSYRADSAFQRGFAKAQVRMTVTSDLEGLVDMLEMMEGSRRVLAIRELNVNQSVPVTATEAGTALRIELVVEALVRKVAKRGVAK
jgi:hypothetical protein